MRSSAEPERRLEDDRTTVAEWSARRRDAAAAETPNSASTSDRLSRRRCDGRRSKEAGDRGVDVVSGASFRTWLRTIGVFFWHS